MNSPGRYVRQERFAPLGEHGQQRLKQSKALICGCGALGSLIAERLVRAGVGCLRLLDRDWVETSNLQRQCLFNEQHADQAAPKAVAAAEELAKINSQVTIEPVVDDLTFTNIEALASDCDLILDGTDNFETRFLINDFCISRSIPWVHGGCLGASGQLMSILPGRTACFRCLVPHLPAPDSIQTCDSAGVLGPAVGIVACWQAAEAIKILSGNLDAVATKLILIDCWDTQCRCVSLNPVPHCPACGLRDFPFLEGRLRTESIVLCGKNAVQLLMPEQYHLTLELDNLAKKLETLGSVKQNPFFVRLQMEKYQITIFKGGRTVVEGTTSPAEAKSLLSRTLGG